MSGRPPSHSRTVFGWAMYDWANSAYVLTTVTAVLPAFYAATVVPENGAVILGTRLAAPTLWGLMVGLSAALVFVIAPVLGAAADYTGLKKRFLAVSCLGGSAAAFCLSLIGAGDIWLTALFFVPAQVGFAAANVFYDAFLPQIAPPGQLDRISGKGFAYGYLGGGLHFLASLAIIALHDRLGLTQAQAARLAMATAALWWAGFSLVTLALVEEKPPALAPDADNLHPGAHPGARRLLALGARRALTTLRTIVSGRRTGRFLLAFLFYNDGIQTVIVMATIFGKDELKLPMTTLMLTLLMIQAVAFAGALIFSGLAERHGTRRVLLAELFLWSGVVLYAFFISSAVEYFVLGALVGLVLGGSQALSRSYFASMIPEGQSAQYFGYFSVVNKLSAIGGPLLFAAIRHLTGSGRLAVLGILVFFVAGIALLWSVPRRGDADRAPQTAQV